jgi:hypothetical protein
MQVAGSWRACTDGFTRPIVVLDALAGDGSFKDDWFLIDTGADHTVLAARTLHRLNLPTFNPPQGLALSGIGGASGIVLVDTTLVFTGTDGSRGNVPGRFAAFPNPQATDISLLGRDILDHFDVIFSRRRDEVWLLRPDHQYQIVSP